MKSLLESLLDNDDKLFAETSMPKKPKVPIDDYFVYEQAWYDILVAMDKQYLNNSDNLKSYLELYIKWFDKFKFTTPENNHIGNNDLSDDFIYMSADQIKRNYAKQVHPISDHDYKWFKKEIKQETSIVIDSYKVVRLLWGDYYGNDYSYLIDLFNENKCFQKDPHYKKYYEDIKIMLLVRYDINIK